MPLWKLKDPDPTDPLHSEIELWCLDYEETVILPMGGIKAAIGGGAGCVDARMRTKIGLGDG